MTIANNMHYCKWCKKQMSGSHRQHRDNPNYKSKMQLNNMNNKFETFESYLQDCAVEDSPETMGGGSDGQQEGCERWIDNLDSADVMEYAEAYGKKMYHMGKLEGIEMGSSLAIDLMAKKLNE